MISVVMINILVGIPYLEEVQRIIIYLLDIVMTTLVSMIIMDLIS